MLNSIYTWKKGAPVVSRGQKCSGDMVGWFVTRVKTVTGQAEMETGRRHQSNVQGASRRKEKGRVVESRAQKRGSAGSRVGQVRPVM